MLAGVRCISLLRARYAIGPRLPTARHDLLQVVYPQGEQSGSHIVEDVAEIEQAERAPGRGPTEVDRLFRVDCRLLGLVCRVRCKRAPILTQDTGEGQSTELIGETFVQSVAQVDADDAMAPSRDAVIDGEDVLH